MKKETLGEEIRVEDIICDICGSSVIPVEFRQVTNDFSGFNEHAQLTATFGFGSKRDGEVIHYDFCEACFTSIERKIEILKSESR